MKSILCCFGLYYPVPLPKHAVLCSVLFCLFFFFTFLFIFSFITVLSALVHLVE